MPNAGRGESEATQGERSPRKGKRSGVHWVFPLGVGLAGLASAAAFLFRGCWHRNLSWPIRAEGEHGHFSYQVCNDCGIMRLFDDRTFRGYGPYGYDLHELIAREHLARRRRMQRAGIQDFDTTGRSRAGSPVQPPSATMSEMENEPPPQD